MEAGILKSLSLKKISKLENVKYENLNSNDCEEHEQSSLSKVQEVKLGAHKPERHFGVILWKVLLPRKELYTYSVVNGEQFEQNIDMIGAKIQEVFSPNGVQNKLRQEDNRSGEIPILCQMKFKNQW